ncbi:MAG: hypothetical protein ACFN4S_00780 [Prevotella conceptionensis]|uniref:hypothetical protein n=1 Tax=Prevotella conceptionensis TaxID=340486 RepID=UPI0002DB3214|nr:hypothetical protein [Prevotella conceptionensis]
MATAIWCFVKAGTDDFELPECQFNKTAHKETMRKEKKGKKRQKIIKNLESSFFIRNIVENLKMLPLISQQKDMQNAFNIKNTALSS